MVDEVPTAPLELGPAEGQHEDEELPEAERKAVENLVNEWKTARAFDRPAMAQIGKDRRYVSGVAGKDWAVNANLLGSYVDILVAFIYARNPKVSIRPAEQAGVAAQRERQLFAKTLQLVVQRLWKDGKLKKAMKRVVRAAFSIGTGWFKAVMLFDTEKDPLIEHELNDVRDNLARIQAKEEQILDPDPTGGGEPVDKQAQVAELELLIEGLEAKIEIVVRKGLAIDFLSSEQVQVGLDVRDVDDYLEAGWLGNEMFIMRTEALQHFPRLTTKCLKDATTYFQRAPVTYNPDGSNVVEGAAQGIEIGMADPHGETAMQYTTNEAHAGAAITDSKGKRVEYIKAIEIWDRRDLHIKTIVEGCKGWAKEPYTPQFASSRFFPYFKVDFFQVDGERHSQSLTHRLSKLQDEYGGVRSSYRLTRQRSIPGTLFNGTQITETDAKKLSAGVHDEFIPVNPKDPEVDMNKLFTEKPQPKVDPMLFDTAPVIGDMEKISGVQEALQTSQTVDKTATQAKIEQGGFAARTTQQRDCVEDTLGEFAIYTAELALQSLTHMDVVKIAGKQATWPEGLPVEAILQLLDVDIEAGSTGRPNEQEQRESWLTIEPMVERLVPMILAMPGTPLALALTEILRTTLTVFDDRMDIERFLPGIAQTTPLDPLIDPITGIALPAPMPGMDPTAAAAAGAAPAPGAPGEPAGEVPADTGGLPPMPALPPPA